MTDESKSNCMWKICRITWLDGSVDGLRLSVTSVSSLTGCVKETTHGSETGT